MCGICGWVGNEPSDTSEHIGQMIGALRKRGPDGNGTWSGNGNLSILGHTRLSIIDVDGSAQPMANEDETVIVTYNGEIYNYPELRRTLIARGHSFRSQGDTEVLVHLYEDYGPAMVEHLDGMFAFAIYDLRQHSLLLARDRIGIKPLYYWHNPRTGELLFASDMSAMLANPMVPRRLNLNALAQYLHFGFVAHPHSWLRDVYQVAPGQTAVWKAGTIRRSQYYTWKYEPRADLADLQTAISELRQALHDSVASHLIADVALGSFMSAGLDSTTTTGFAQGIRRKSGEAINSFTVQFWMNQYDESSRARAIAADLGTHHTEIEAEELNFDRCSIDKLIDGLGEPFGDSSLLSVYLLCQQARPHVKVALSGDGGDELFLGYAGYRKQSLARRFRLVPATARQLGANVTMGSLATWPRRLNKYLRLSLLDDAGLIIDWHRRWEWDKLCNLLGGELFNELFPRQDAPFPELHEQIGKGETGGLSEQQMRFHMLVVLPCDGLFKVDRMSMAHGLEVRVPILANRMLEYGRQLPLAMRTRKGRTKEPLRTLAETFSPRIAQPSSSKKGFSFPVDLWIRNKAAQYWREWELTSTLANIGFQAHEVDRMVTSYTRIIRHEEHYDLALLSSRLFDLMLLAVWLDKHRICV